jgi:peptidoglycan/LPS O-acetylase OafA/YrhL
MAAGSARDAASSSAASQKMGRNFMCFSNSTINAGGDPSSISGLPLRQPVIRFEALDGLRGLAAFYVIFFHMGVLLKPLTDHMSKPWRMLIHLTDHGHDAVVLFIVLSGFALMLPVARSTDKQLRGGLREYIRRRAKRILRPYYAALAIFLILGLMWNYAFARAGTVANPFMGSMSIAGIASHFVLIHNFSRPWAMTVDSPMWSVATEWQIYFFFPLVLLPIWRRTGIILPVLIGLLIGIAPVMLLPASTNFDTFCPWFLALFAMGMAAADLANSPAHEHKLSPTAWGILTLLLAVTVADLELCTPGLWNRLASWAKDFLYGVVLASMLVYIARCQLSARHSRAVLPRLLESRRLIALGAFSYSLYLVHLPIVQLTDIFLSQSHSPKIHVVALFIIAPAISLVVAYLFHLAFERQSSLHGPPKKLAPIRNAPPLSDLPGIRRLSA